MCARLATPPHTGLRPGVGSQTGWVARLRHHSDLLTPVLMLALLVQTIAVFVAAIGSGAFTHPAVSSEQVARAKPRSDNGTTCQQEPAAPAPSKIRLI